MSFHSSDCVFFSIKIVNYTNFAFEIKLFDIQLYGFTFFFVKLAQFKNKVLVIIIETTPDYT